MLSPPVRRWRHCQLTGAVSHELRDKARKIVSRKEKKPAEAG